MSDLRWFSMLVSASVRQLGFSGTSYRVTLSTRKSISGSGPEMMITVLLVSGRKLAYTPLPWFRLAVVVVIVLLLQCIVLVSSLSSSQRPRKKTIQMPETLLRLGQNGSLSSLLLPSPSSPPCHQGAKIIPFPIWSAYIPHDSWIINTIIRSSETTKMPNTRVYLLGAHVVKTPSIELPHPSFSHFNGWLCHRSQKMVS